MRTRNRSTQLAFPSSLWRRMDRGTAPQTMSASNLPDKTEVMVDQVNPGYFPAEKLGKLLPVSPMAQSVISTNLVMGSAHYVADISFPDGSVIPDQHIISGDGLLGVFDPSRMTQPVLPEVNKGALLQSALASAQTNAFDKLTFAAEFRKTVEMFATAQQRYADHFRKVAAQAQRNARSNKAPKSDKMLDFLTEAWFEYRFGLRPILYDIQAAQEMLRRLAEGSPILSRGWASDEASSSHRGGFSVDQFTIGGFFGTSGIEGGASFATSGTKREQAYTWTTTVSGRASVGVNVTTRDLTMADPVLTLWELTPMSVFIDYFVSVGDMLAAFSPFATGTFAFATYTRTVTHEIVETSRWAAADSGSLRWSGSCTPSTVVQTRVFKDRTLETVSPTLSINVQLDMGRVIDLIALSWALRRRLTALTRMLTRR